MSEPMRTFAFLCPQCRQTVVAQRTTFAVAAGRAEIPCPCGKSTLISEYQNTSFRLQVPCIACGGTHTVTVPEHAMLHKDAIVLTCKRTGFDCCAIGEEERVFQAAKRMEASADQLPEKREEGTAFLNEFVMSEVLSEIKDIAGRGGISCTCGSHDWGMDIYYASVQLRCKKCGAVLKIPAAASEDIDAVCCQDRLLIHSAQG